MAVAVPEIEMFLPIRVEAPPGIDVTRNMGVILEVRALALLARSMREQSAPSMCAPYATPLAMGPKPLAHAMGKTVRELSEAADRPGVRDALWFERVIFNVAAATASLAHAEDPFAVVPRVRGLLYDAGARLCGLGSADHMARLAETYTPSILADDWVEVALIAMRRQSCIDAGFFTPMVTSSALLIPLWATYGSRLTVKRGWT